MDILFGCEVGGFRQGFRCTGMNVWDILQTRLGSTVSVAEIDNYIAVFRKSSALLHGPSSKFTFGEGCFDAAITRFDICPGGASQPVAHVIVGNLHIDYSNNPRWSVLERQKIVRLLRDELETYTAPQPDMPVVRLIVGDDNLSTEEAMQALDDDSLRAKTADFRARLEEGETLDQLLPEVFAVVPIVWSRMLARGAVPALLSAFSSPALLGSACSS